MLGEFVINTYRVAEWPK